MGNTKDIKGNFVITIGREFGSGGHSIGKMLAEMLKVDFYDSEIIDEASKRSGVCTSYLEKADEKAPNFLEYALFSGSNQENILSSGNFYVLQSNVILNLAGKGSCVIVGRSADYILRNHPCCINLFISSPLDFRIRNVMQRMNLSEDAAKVMIERKDRSRMKFYNFYTEKEWGNATSYDLCIDSSILGLQNTAFFLSHFVKEVLVR